MHAMMKCGGVKVWLNSFLTRTLDGRECSASRPDHFTPVESITTYYSKGGFWAPEPVWTLREEKIIPWSSRESKHDYPFKPVAQSLYRLHYPSSKAYILGYTVLIF